MSLTIRDPELLSVCESSMTFSFGVADGAGLVDAPAEVRLNGRVRASSEGVSGTRLLRVEGLEPATEYRIEIAARGGEAAPSGEYLPASAETLPGTRARQVASLATLNDLHFGEPRFGGTMRDDGEFGEEAPGFPVALESDGDVPYWQLMNEDAVADINKLGVDATIIKGDIADRGRPEQFDIARRTFGRLAVPHHAFLGNHDHYALLDGVEVDGYALLNQLRAPRSFDLAGWRIVLLDTVEPGKHHGVFPDERLAWLAETLAETRELGVPTLLFMHHQPVPPEFFDKYPNSIGLIPDHSLRMFDLLGQHPQVKAVLIGHTHRNRVRRYPASGNVPYVEVHCVKDYPGGFAHYRLFDDGSFRQQVFRTSSERALAHSTRCAGFFKGGYRRFALGSLADRCFVVGP
jgi:predicted phosphodiesterase